MAVLTKTEPRYNGLRVSREEYLDLEDDGYKYDMNAGVLQLTPSPAYSHGKSGSDFIIQLGKYLEQNDRGEIVNEIDVLLPDGGDVLRPDVSFILKERLRIVKTHIHGPPDLVAEILSESTANRDLVEKADRYLACGVQEYWIIDPRNRSLAVWYNTGPKDAPQWEKHRGDVLESRLLPGFRITAKEFWK